MAAFILPVLLFALFWALLIRPQQRRMRQAQQMVASLEPGDEVVTAGGVFGAITAIDADTLSIEVAPGVVLRVLRGAISQRVGPEREQLEEEDDEVDDDEDAVGELDPAPDDVAPEPHTVDSTAREEES